MVKFNKYNTPHANMDMRDKLIAAMSVKKEEVSVPKQTRAERKRARTERGQAGGSWQ